jgi:hypothetical protein
MIRSSKNTYKVGDKVRRKNNAWRRGDIVVTVAQLRPSSAGVRFVGDAAGCWYDDNRFELVEEISLNLEDYV